mgnify:CR=1 FL=1
MCLLKSKAWQLIPLVWMFVFISCNKDKGSYLRNLLPAKLYEISSDDFKEVFDQVPIYEVNLDQSIDENLFPILKIGEEQLAQPSFSTSKRDTLYVADQLNNNIQQYSMKGGLIKTTGREGKAPGEFKTPTSIHINKKGYYVEDLNNNRTQYFDRHFNYQNMLPMVSDLNSTMSINEDYIFIPHASSEFKYGIQIFNSSSPFAKVKNIMPYFSNKKSYYLGLNMRVITASANGMTYVIYKSLPFIFVYDRSLSLHHIVHLNSKALNHFIIKNNTSVIQASKSKDYKNFRIAMNCIFADNNNLFITVGYKVYRLEIEGKQYKPKNSFNLYKNVNELNMENLLFPSALHSNNGELYVLPLAGEPLIYVYKNTQ